MESNSRILVLTVTVSGSSVSLLFGMAIEPTAVFLGLARIARRCEPGSLGQVGLSDAADACRVVSPGVELDLPVSLALRRPSGALDGPAMADKLHVRRGVMAGKEVFRQGGFPAR